MALEHRFDIQFVAAQALREKQIQPVYRPFVAVHKWFVRRPGSLFRSLALAEFADAPLADAYYRPHDFAGKTVADPFMGGGTRSSRPTGSAATWSAATSTPWPPESAARRWSTRTWTATPHPPAA